MVAPIVEDSTTHWDAMKWAVAQGEHLASPAHAAVLLYLSTSAFYQAENPEGAEVGQVLFHASKYERIMQATAIKSRSTVRKVLNDLQEQAYVYRAERRSRGTHDPLQIQVLWSAKWDHLREGLRAGTKTLPVALLNRPTASPRKASVTPLRAVEAVAE